MMREVHLEAGELGLDFAPLGQGSVLGLVLQELGTITKHNQYQGGFKPIYSKYVFVDCIKIHSSQINVTFNRASRKS